MSSGSGTDGDAVTLQGTALDAHAGAVIMLDDESPVYVEGLSRWSPEENGKRVEITGILRAVKMTPDPPKGKDVIQRHGMTGSQTVLSNATWRVIS
jgi:hypothetical protein